MSDLNKLFSQLDAVEKSLKVSKAEIDAKIQTALNAVYADWSLLQRMLEHLESGTGVVYQGNECGDIEAHLSMEELDEISERERPYFDEYLTHKSCGYVNWDDKTLYICLGSEEITIQDDTRHDNGVWQNHKCIIDESEYKSDDGEIDEEKRNELIEAHMEKSGCFPGVFHVTQHGDIFPISTQPKGGKK
jgi:hypothetical protein